MPGNTGWGGNFWAKGTWGLGIQLPIELNETVTLSESLNVWLPLRVSSAVALSAYLVEVEFSQNLDYGYAPVLTPSNYVIPGLTVSNVIIVSTSNKVRLITSEQAATIYALTVNNAHSYAGDPLGPSYHTVNFAGFPVRPSFFAAAQSATKVELVFSTTMLQNAAFTDATSYQISDLNGNTVVVTSATASGPSPVQRVTLKLGASLTPGGHYVATILSSSVQTLAGLSIYPVDDVFQWADMLAPLNVGPISIPIEDFSGEASGGLLGQPLGQVFFSPAFDVATADSIIQVDEVSVCTQAYDVYTIPSLPDPNPLSIYSPGQPYSTTLNADVLWATAERLGLARFNLVDNQTETMPSPTDGPADATLQETFDQSKVALLNVEDWVLYDGVGTSFICADNTVPVGPGATTNINLQP
jgi:hypothetical protein